MNIITRLAPLGTTIILCTHILSDVERVANRIGIIRDGVMALEGTIEEIQQKFEEQSKKIILRVFGEPENAISALSAATGGRFLFEKKSGVFEIQIGADENEEEKAKAILAALSEKGITPSVFQLKEKTLEEIYLETIG